MSLFDSLRRSADHYPGGRPVLSLRISKGDEVMRKELSGASTHKLGAVDALAIARLCVEAGTSHCYDYAHYVAQECGGEFVPHANDHEAGESPMRRVSTLAREAGDVTSTFIDALSDGKVSDNELVAIEREVAEAQEALRKLLQAARAVNAAGKPTSGRPMVTLPVRDMSAEAACQA